MSNSKYFQPLKLYIAHFSGNTLPELSCLVSSLRELLKVSLSPCHKINSVWIWRVWKSRDGGGIRVSSHWILLTIFLNSSKCTILKSNIEIWLQILLPVRSENLINSLPSRVSITFISSTIFSKLARIRFRGAVLRTHVR